MIGVSIYPGMDSSIEEILDYMNKAYSLGIKTLFTSAHIPEVKENFLKDFKRVLEESSRLGFTSIVDISKNYFDELDMRKYKIDYLRLDFGFTIEETAKISKEYDFGISVNATTLTEEEINEFIKYGGNVEKINACHNYYPRKDTGVSEELFIEKNKFLKKFGVKTLAFVPSQYRRRGPMYEGLPTLEKHRYLNSMISAQHLMDLGIDYVIVGDEMSSDEELKNLSALKKDTILLPIKLLSNLTEVELDLINKSHTNRMDPGEYVIRSQESRLIKRGRIIQNNIANRRKYYLTIDNELYGRYEGELQILKKDFEADNRVNVIGDCSEGSILIDNLKPGDKFKFHILED
jgi:hypothetical protein